MSSIATKAINANKSVIVSTTKTPRVSRGSFTPVSVPRREALGFLATVLGGAIVMTERTAEAIEVPFQESIAGRPAVAQSEASMQAYGMEGIKKGGLSTKRKRQILDKLRESALQNAKQ
eukprot:g8003.t1